MQRIMSRTKRWSRIGPVAVSALWVAGAVAEASPSQPSHVFVVNTQDASISLVELAAMKETRRVPVGSTPYGIAVSLDGKTVAVGVEGEEKVKFFDTADFHPRGEFQVGKMKNDHIVLTQDGKHVLVANFYSDDVLAIDIGSFKEAFRITGCSAPHVVKYGPLKRNAYVTCKRITGIAVLDPVGRALVKLHELNVNPRSLTFSDDETRLYFGSFWVDGFFEMEIAIGKVSRLITLPPPPDNASPQEVTYHGVETVAPNILLAANEGRSYLDAVELPSGRLLDRLADVSKPCCVERVPDAPGAPIRALISNIGDGTLQLVQVSKEGKLKALAKAKVGQAPKRVAFFSPSAP